jgi:hypothetical protein
VKTFCRRLLRVLKWEHCKKEYQKVSSRSKLIGATHWNIKRGKGWSLSIEIQIQGFGITNGRNSLKDRFCTADRCGTHLSSITSPYDLLWGFRTHFGSIA